MNDLLYTVKLYRFVGNSWYKVLLNLLRYRRSVVNNFAHYDMRGWYRVWFWLRGGSKGKAKQIAHAKQKREQYK